ncbi:pentatricopeptide repeat-containing protein [Strigomonas culicis]|uniref:Pentatricopeptide repeat-containing protein n=1 Tax=Strigomonas culicis TaxID=28005 RepID=S9TRK8_9TRYP|nr:pentatricopeptide repeat-containing protein [Strigomonas culicis]|eukprot:EPY19103.1 pentatricopeptide repeat-containing protein [Strigomonas culicis]
MLGNSRRKKNTMTLFLRSKKTTEVMQNLLDLGDRLLQSPPSTEPKSGKESSLYKLPLAIEEEMPLLTSNSTFEAMEKSLNELQSEEKKIMPVEEFSAQSNVPIAYLDDSSERSNASKELCVILEKAGLDYTEEGLIVITSALSKQHYYLQARSIFDFAVQVGLGPNAELYKALMKHSALKGDVNQSMALIEEMKDRGITPRIGNWHELMRSFHKARDYPAVTQIIDNMKMYANIEPNEVTFALQLRALGKDTSQMNSLAESVQIFDQMENVYGYIASRPHYDALMYTLSQSPLPEMRLRCEELAQKMDLMGITWNANTYLNLIRSAQVVGDVAAVEKYLSKMRDDRVPVQMAHLSWAIQAHVQHLVRLNYESLKEEKKDIVPIWLDHMNTCFGIYELVVNRGWEMQVPFVNALLRLCCQTTILAMEHLPDNSDAIGRFEQQANKIWNATFDEWHLSKDVYSFECYIALLAHQQRIDEAEKLFQQMVMQDDMVPSRRTYECLLFMHLSSGEEGGAARALRYLEAMENAQIPVRASLLKKIVRVNNASGYKRDMKRRARRIMQAREEYLAKKEEGIAFHKDHAAEEAEAEDDSVPKPLPVPVNTTLAWWQKWKEDSISKHELFEEENADGTPKGETFAEKNEALAKMGITSPFQTIEDVPAPHKHKLLPKLREEGETAGSLWALDGGELSYPKDGGGPQGWGVRLWRERAIMKKEFQKVQDGQLAPSDFSNLGNGVRVAGDQLDIEESGARNAGELTDWRKYENNRYDDGKAKPASE